MNDIQMKMDRKRRFDVTSVYEYCPLTRLGVYGLKSTHNIPRLCTKTTNRRRYLYVHLSNYHRLKSTYANKIAKAVQHNQDPMKTMIFPPDSTEVIVGDMQCPFDSTAAKFNEKNAIPNTPCTTAVFYNYFQAHLQRVHSISRTNAKLIFRAMKNSGTISHVQFEEDLCDAKND